MTPRHIEDNANTLLGNLLLPMLGKATVLAQNTGVIADQPLLNPDVLIAASGRSPVVVEAEYDPADHVEQEAKDRLGLRVTPGNQRIEAAIALRYPEAVKSAYIQEQAVRDARFSYCVFRVEKYDNTPEQEVNQVSRFPASGWMTGSLTDLADLIRLTSFPRLAVNDAEQSLQRGIDRAAGILDGCEFSRPALNGILAKLLGMPEAPQTRRMAVSIIANAMIFQERLASARADVKSLAQTSRPGVRRPQSETLEAWETILKINYWPIFEIARQLLECIPNWEVGALLNNLSYAAEEVATGGVENTHDLTGRIFQRLISDRKYLAAFYTLPPAAALLARLAVAKLDGVDWSDAQELGKLRVADLACGTGALLAAVYDQIAARHERAGGDAAALHPIMMEEVFYGCDIVPWAVHITSSTLSGFQPTVQFEKSRLYSMPFGRQDAGEVKLGSLELLQAASVQTLFNMSDPGLTAEVDPAVQVGGNGDETVSRVTAEMPDGWFDLVIMNPPFTRNTTREGETAGKIAAAFAAFGASAEDQQAMADRMGEMKAGTCYHGNVGMGSGFAALADKKLKPGGVLALVLPLTAITGVDWAKFREMLAAGYNDITVVSTVATGREIAFSADTNMVDCLIIARKNKADDPPAERAHFISLNRVPRSFDHANAVAQSILAGDYIRQLEDGPYGGARLMVGDETVGEMITTPIAEHWGGVRIADYALPQTAHALAQSRLWLPGSAGPLELKVAPLGSVGERGKYHLDIIGRAPRGPFDKADSSPTATYPALWNHDASKETKMICSPDSQLVARTGLEQKANLVWATASRVHINQDFGFGSQPLCAAFTERETIGGRAWPNVKFSDARFDYAFVLWSNSTLGLVNFWWHSGRQQPGRGITTITASRTFPVLDLRELTDAQLATAQEIFEDFRDKEFLPANRAANDPNRALLDRRVVCDLLGFDESVYQGVRQLAGKWCAEPSVSGK